MQSKLETQTTKANAKVSQLNTRLEEKEDKASKSLLTLHITNKMDVKRLEGKLKIKTAAQGVSDIEYSNLKMKIRRSEEKSLSLAAEQQRLSSNKEKLLLTEEYLVKAVKDYTEKNELQKGEIQELNEDIAEKRASIDLLNREAQKVKNEIGYDASDLGSVLASPQVNNDYDSSKEELRMLRKKLDALVTEYKEQTV